MTFLEKLRKEERLFDALHSSASKVLIGPFLFDLYWGESSVNMLERFKEPGIMFDKGSRTFVLLFVDHEIRYFAGIIDPYASHHDREEGSFADELTALTFGYAYLIDQHALSDIKVARTIRFASRNFETKLRGEEDYQAI